LDVNVTESLAPMRPYNRLLELGAGSSDELPADLEKWILDGEGSGADSSAEWEVRRADVERHFATLTGRFTEHFDRIAQRNDLLDFPGSYEIRGDILASLGDLLRAVSAVQPVSVAGGFF
jgi:hypothetical protein